MKKRREILEAMREDSRISTLEGKLQRKSSEAEALRRFATREVTSDLGSRNQLEQVQQLLAEEQARAQELRAKLNLAKLDAERERQARESQHQEEMQDLLMRLKAAQVAAEPPAAAAAAADARGAVSGGVESEGAASLDRLARQRAAENELRMAKLEAQQLQRRAQRETRRADRSADELRAVREQLDSVLREQQVKDQQLESMRRELQALYAPTVETKAPDNGDHRQQTPRDAGPAAATAAAAGESPGESQEDAFAEVLEGELEAMRESYEGKLAELREELGAARREAKGLKDEVAALRGAGVA